MPYLSIFIKALKYFAIGVFDTNDVKPSVNRVHYTLHFVTWFIAIVCDIGGCFDGNTFNEIVLSVAVVANMLLSMTKHAVFSSNRSTVHNFIKLIENEAASLTKTDVYIKKAMTDTKVVIWNYMFITLICTVAYLGETIFTDNIETEEIKTKYWEVAHIYLPYDFVIYERFGVFRIFMVAINFYNAYCQIFLDIFSASLFAHLGRQFEAVADLFNNKQYIQNFKESRVQLKEAINYHQLLLRYAADLQRMYNVTFLVQLIGCCLPLCLCMLLTVHNLKSTEGNLMNVVSHISFLVILVYQLFLYTRSADIIKERALLVSEGVYLSDWHLASPNTRRELVWVMARAQRPIRYSALGIFPMTISTFGQIIRSVYGAFSLLTNVD